MTTKLLEVGGNMNKREEPGKRHKCQKCGKGFHDYWECEEHQKMCGRECCEHPHGAGEDGHN